MKRRNPLRKIRIFLEHLESNFHNPDKRTREVLNKTFPPDVVFSDIYTYCLHNRLIKPVKTDKKRGFVLEVSIEGLEFLQRQKQIDRGREAHKFQRQLVITSLILAMGVSFNAFNKTDFSLKSYFSFFLISGIFALTLYVLYTFFKRG